jgi:HPt (histidine-containing phosphotransfer) domain-containing protein
MLSLKEAKVEVRFRGDLMNHAIELLQEIARDDLEQCEAAIRADDKAVAIDAIERAFAKLDTAIDMLRSEPHAA